MCYHLRKYKRKKRNRNGEIYLKKKTYIIDTLLLGRLEGGVVDPSAGLVEPAAANPLGEDGVGALKVVDTGDVASTPLKHTVQLEKVKS